MEFCIVPQVVDRVGEISQQPVLVRVVIVMRVEYALEALGASRDGTYRGRVRLQHGQCESSLNVGTAKIRSIASPTSRKSGLPVVL